MLAWGIKLHADFQSLWICVRIYTNLTFGRSLVRGRWLRYCYNRRHGSWTTSFRPVPTQGRLKERRRKEKDFFMGPEKKVTFRIQVVLTTYQNVVLPTMTLTVPGSLQFLVKVWSIPIPSSSSSALISESSSSASQSSRSHCAEPEDLNIPLAAACVSVGELNAAAGALGPRELRAIRIWDGLVLMLPEGPILDTATATKKLRETNYPLNLRNFRQRLRIQLRCCFPRSSLVSDGVRVEVKTDQIEEIQGEKASRSQQSTFAESRLTNCSFFEESFDLPDHCKFQQFLIPA